MGIINGILAAPISFILTPLRDSPPLVGLTIMSIIAGAGALFVVERTLPHQPASLIKRSIAAALLEIVIFNHDVRTIARAQFEILKLNLNYVRLSALTLVLTSVPLVLLMAHLHGYYGYVGLTPGKSALLTIDVASRDRRPPVTLDAPDGVLIASPMVWIPSLGQAIYRILPTRAGEYNVTLHIGPETYSKTLVASTEWVSRSPARVTGGLNTVLYPAEDPLPGNGPIRKISIDYPETNLDVAGWRVHWTWLFLSFSLLASFILKAVGLFQHHALHSSR